VFIWSQLGIKFTVNREFTEIGRKLLIPLNEHFRGNYLKPICDVIIQKDSDIDAAAINIMRCQNCIIFCKTEFLPHLCSELAGNVKSHVLITHNSDFHIDEKKYGLKPPCIKTWFARNTEIERPDLIPIPIGIENEGEGCSGDAEFMSHIRVAKLPPRNLVYLNVNTRTNPKEREPCVEILKDKPFVVYQPNRISFHEYCSEASSCIFVASPPGNGMDCYRTWEALFMGLIPIVKRNSNMESFSNTRMLIIDDWNELNSLMLLGFKDKAYSDDETKLSYWIERIKDAYNRL